MSEIETEHDRFKVILEALKANADSVFLNIAHEIVSLGAKYEWEMEDNFSCTEGIAEMAGSFGLPSATSQDEESLVFYGEIAMAFGYPADIAAWEVCDSNGCETRIHPNDPDGYDVDGTPWCVAHRVSPFVLIDVQEVDR